MLQTRSRWIVLVLILSVFLGACGAPAQQSGAPADRPAGDSTAPAAEKAGIAFWFQPSQEGETTSCLVQNAIDTFNAQSTTVEVQAVAQPNSWDATRTALAAGEGPDIVVTPGPSFAFELVKAGQLLALDEFSDEFGWSKLFVPWALNLGKVDGKLYSIPTELETLVLYYNKTLFEQHGWQPPKTIDELMALSKQISDAGVIPFAHANAEWRPTNEWFVGEFLNHVAGPQLVYEALKGARPWTDPEFVRAIELLNQMQQEKWFMGGLDRYYTATGDERYAAFGNGTAAMNIEGSWFFSDIDTYFGQEAGNSNEWDWVPVPSSGGEAIFDLGIGSTYSVNKASQHPRAAAEFLSYMFSPEIQARLLAECDRAPAPVRLEADALTGIDPRKAALFEALGKASDANNYGYTTWTFWPPKSDVYIYEEVERVWAGEITTQQYLEGLQKTFSEELKAGDIPPLPER